MHPLDQVVSDHALLKHPFFQRWVEGRLTTQEPKQAATHYYPVVKTFPTYLSAVHSQCLDSSSLHQTLLENPNSKESGNENLFELWLHICQAIGLWRDQVTDAGITIAADALWEFLSGLDPTTRLESFRRPRKPRSTERKNVASNAQ